jgi:uncharacterized membrane protein YfhO
MQSSALFPLTLLFGFAGGLVWFHIALEIVAGVSTYLLLRRFGVGDFVASAGGALFALSGTFAWLANSVVNPIAFLPMLLLGIELIIDDGATRRKGGWQLAACALALSLYSGFPEVAYFDGLFCLAWALVRLSATANVRRGEFARRFGFAGLVGVVLALPVLVPFADFLKVAYVGGHTSAVDGSWSLSFKALPMLVDPYVYGTIQQNAHLTTVWGEVGGFFGTGVVALAIIGAVGASNRRLRLLLVTWTAIAVAGSFDVLHVRALWNLLPFVNTASVPRYVMPSCELALIILAVLGIGDLVTNHRSRHSLFCASLFMIVVLLASVLEARHLNRGLTLSTGQRVLFALLSITPFVVAAILIAVSRLSTTNFAIRVVTLTLVCESLLWFVVPTLSAPRSIAVDYAPIAYLLAHQGEQRFLDLAVLSPNWGSQFGLNALNAIDLPFPTAFKIFIQRDLYPGVKPANAFTWDRPAGVVAQEDELATHFAAYEDASVKYLVAPRTLTLSSQLTSLGVHQVFRDRIAAIYELPHPRPFFSASSQCHVTSTGADVASVTCTSAGTILRTELAMPGWSARVNGHSSTIVTVNGVYQQVNVPAGTSTVTYSFVPPHEDDSLLAGLLAGLVLVGSLAVGRRTRNERTQNEGATK